MYRHIPGVESARRCHARRTLRRFRERMARLMFATLERFRNGSRLVDNVRKDSQEEEAERVARPRGARGKGASNKRSETSLERNRQKASSRISKRLGSTRIRAQRVRREKSRVRKEGILKTESRLDEQTEGRVGFQPMGKRPVRSLPARGLRRGLGEIETVYQDRANAGVDREEPSRRMVVEWCCKHCFATPSEVARPNLDLCPVVVSWYPAGRRNNLRSSLAGHDWGRHERRV